ncbi:MAG: lipoyl synthase [Candidatus Hydrogenedentes bacterium]|nr:lipoyl synthase [Candidatus Hydrogenedentota bacterium]
MASRFPEWIRRPWASGQDFGFTKDVVEGLELHTVCQSARCPNMSECWQRRTATLMILGNTCTRSCRYCSVPAGKPEPPDPSEPEHVADAIARMNLKHAVITSVTRDDLSDGGAGHIAATVLAVRQKCPATTLELLVPDFQGDLTAVDTVMAVQPEVFSHNIETVERLYPSVRGRRCTYETALGVLRHAANSRGQTIIKSAFMVGHGETPEEVGQTLQHLLDAGCEAVCIGQYLRPTPKQREVAEYVTPEQFKDYESLAYELGFAFAVAGPFVRSSYRSDELMKTEFARGRVQAV